MLSPKMQAHVERAKKIGIRIVLWGLVAANVAFLIPGTYYAIKVGNLFPAAVMIILSFVVWGVGFAVFALFRSARRAQKRRAAAGVDLAESR